VLSRTIEPTREARIIDDILVDAHTSEELAMSWRVHATLVLDSHSREYLIASIFRDASERKSRMRASAKDRTFRDLSNRLFLSINAINPYGIFMSSLAQYPSVGTSRQLHRVVKAA